MTNPDRDELVKLLVWGKSRITGEVGVMAQDAYTSIGHYIASDNGWFLQGQSGWNASASMDAAKAAAQADYEARIRSALVEVPAVKGEPEPVASERISQLAADLVVSGWTAGDHGIELAKSRAERKLLEFACDEIERHMRSHTAPPADAGMREALERLKQGIRDIAQACVDGRVCDDVAWFTEIPAETLFDKCCNLLGEDLPTGQPALTAPGATTKSDGESFVTTNPDGSVTLDAYADKSRDELKTRCRELCSALNEWQFIAMEAATAHGNCLSNVPEYARTKIADMIEAYRDDDEPGPSDPSSTRSEVTVEELARYLDPLVFDDDPVVRHRHCSPLRYEVCQSRLIDKARALLDQFEITRRK